MNYIAPKRNQIQVDLSSASTELPVVNVTVLVENSTILATAERLFQEIDADYEIFNTKKFISTSFGSMGAIALMCAGKFSCHGIGNPERLEAALKAQFPDFIISIEQQDSEEPSEQLKVPVKN